ncbi:MAG TPA: GNAT family N-acetyltransferase [Anaerolineales bacterium]|nr:GNAT family N-acetyltransferase [Anaerolineales bacterium]
MNESPPPAIARLVEFGEAEAYADLYNATPPDYAAQFGIGVHRIESAFMFTALAFDIPLFNRVVGLGLREPATEAMVDEAIAHFQGRGVKHFAFQTSPEAQPVGLGGWLTARNLRSPDNWVKMIRGTEPPPEIKTDLRVELIGPDDTNAFSEIAAIAFGMPPVVGAWLTPITGRAGWRHYLAFAGDGPVGCGALFVKDKIGWLGIAGTLPAARGRGAQGALMAGRIRDATELGCEWIITETGEETLANPNPSYRNMVRMGFKLIYPRPNYQP